MASDEARRRDENATGKTTEIRVEKDMVPKLTTHFESLAEKSGGDQERAGEFEAKESSNGSRGGGEEGGRERERETPSLDEISKHRAMAQQNSVEAIRGAEERYARETEASSQGLGSAAASFMKEKGEKAKEAAIETGKVAAAKASNVVVQVKDTAVETGKTAATKTGELVVGAKEKTVEAAKAAGGYMAEKVVSAKDAAAEKVVSAKDAAAEKAVSAKDTVVEKAVSAKDAAAEKAVSAKDAAAEKAVSAKDAAAEKAVSAKDAVTEKAVSAKDAVARTTTEFIGKNKEGAESTESKGKTGEGESKGERGMEPMEEVKREEERGGILEAIGETVVEIAQTAKGYVAGGKGGQGELQQSKQ